MQVGQLVANGQQAPQSLYTELRQLTNDPNIGVSGPSAVPFNDAVPSQSAALAREYGQPGVFFAAVTRGVTNYQEPSTLPSILAGYGSALYDNMCGPGSATKLLSHYIPWTIGSYSNPTFAGPGYQSPQTFIAYLAAGAPNPGGQSYNHYAINPNQGMMNKNDPTAGYQWNTENGDEANVINQVLGSSFYTYGTDYAGDGALRFNTMQFPLSSFTNELSYNLEGDGVPMVMAADTRGLQGWWPNSEGGYAIHLVTINGYKPAAIPYLAQLWYFDSASNSSAYGNNVNAFHHNWYIASVVNGNINGLIDSVW